MQNKTKNIEMFVYVYSTTTLHLSFGYFIWPTSLNSSFPLFSTNMYAFEIFFPEKSFFLFLIKIKIKHNIDNNNKKKKTNSTGKKR